MTAPSCVDAPSAALGRGRTGIEFLRYFACSAAALGVDTAVYAALLSIGMSWAGAAALGFGAGLAVAYTLSVRYVFVQRRLSDARLEFTIFAVIGALGLLLTEALLWLMIERSGIEPLIAKLVAASAVFLSNYTLRKLILFTGPQFAITEVIRNEQ